MTRIRYTMPAGSQGGPYMRGAFARNAAPDVETLVRKRLTARLDGFHCDPRVMHAPHAAGPEPAGTRIVSNDADDANDVERGAV